MAASTLLDPNIFIYQLDGTDPRKQLVAGGLVRDALRAHHACFSIQVVQDN